MLLTAQLLGGIIGTWRKKMRKLKTNQHFLMPEDCERIGITVGNLILYIIQNDQGIIFDAYANSRKLQDEGFDFINTMTVWFDDAEEE
jgi:hypothetical protein